MREKAVARNPLGFLGSLLMIGLIQVYRLGISPLIGPRCRHLPTCSEYGLEAVRRHGAWRGFWLTLARIARCHPWGSHGFDPVPAALQPQPIYAPWRYGVWRLSEADLAEADKGSEEAACRTSGKHV